MAINFFMIQNCHCIGLFATGFKRRKTDPVFSNGKKSRNFKHVLANSESVRPIFGKTHPTNSHHSCPNC